MDDDRIRQLTSEVLTQVRGGGRPADLAELEARVTALERIVSRLVGNASAPSAPGPLARPAAAPVVAAPVEVLPPADGTPVLSVSLHPALQVLNVPSGSESCNLEPNKSCSHCHRCRSFGH